ncbi:GNAT family N-acetyltransferase [Flavobacterium pallidum]|uniref:N-acetyltransferase domain-containing protein n=1 Tax=Flavobacterium pallidum TaxID=2172098 RepID=A0A2S1SIT7_9FLAO|nr:GNAT family N-acetyltransferase [Flavobacterium pallidum]AWI26326.1 hypothetical protein HYN49_10670 [Flavobacterium pallidum]
MAPHNIIIRFAEKQDLSSYIGLRKFSLRESPFAFSDSWEDEVSKTPESYESEIVAVPSEHFTLVAFTPENECIGFISCTRDKRKKARHRALLHSLYVLPGYRGNSIGKRLIGESRKIISAVPDVEQLQLWVLLSGEDSAIGFYEKAGFEEMGGVFKDDLKINGKYVDAVCMVMHL